MKPKSNRTFNSEDNRKTKLFENWNAYLENFHPTFNSANLKDVFEGTVTVADISTNEITLRREDMSVNCSVQVSPEVAKYTAREDMLYMVLGLSSGRWWPLDVVMIGSAVMGHSKKTGIHLSYNPRMIDDEEPSYKPTTSADVSALAADC